MTRRRGVAEACVFLAVLFRIPVLSPAAEGREAPEGKNTTASTPAPALPARVTDLGVEQRGPTSIRLTWTAPGGGGGRVTGLSYDIRHAPNRVFEATWAAATSLRNVPSPGRAGTVQEMSVPVEAGRRYWFAMKTSDPRRHSLISNSPANPPQSLDQVDVFTFCFPVTNARLRRLIRVMQPDFLERAAFEWIGTAFLDRGYEGVMPHVERLRKDGALLGNGFAGNYWLPDRESIGPGVDREKARGGKTNWSPEVFRLVLNAHGENQLIYKGRKMIDAGFDALEVDETRIGLKRFVDEMHRYARSKGRRVYVTGNADSWASPGPAGGPGGFADADYCLRQYPRTNAYFNAIPWYRARNTLDGHKPSFAFIDFGTSGFTCYPDGYDSWPYWLRLYEAQMVASGTIPGSTHSWNSWLDTYDHHVFTAEVNHAKFLRENRELIHNLAFITPATLTATANVFLSAFEQPGRTVLHVVNGAYDARAFVLTKQERFSVKIALKTAPTRVWMTTPDRLSSARRTTPAYAFEHGVATIEIPELECHNVVVIEQGATYVPAYAPMEIVFPFPIRKSIPVGNRVRIHAVQTEGFEDTFVWRVDGTGSTRANSPGAVDAGGYYRAPESVPPGGTVRITASSREDPKVSSSFTIRVVSAPAVPWRETFAADEVGAIPGGWEIVDGRGDFQVALDGRNKVLHQYNMGDARCEGERAGYSALIAAGDQNWTTYAYSFRVKQITEPYVWYDMERPSTFVGAVFAYGDGKHYVVYKLCKDDKARLIRYENDSAAEIGTAADCAFPPVGAWVDVKVAFDGSKAELRVRGARIRNDVLRAKGAVGVTTSFTQCYFKDFSVDAIR